MFNNVFEAVLLLLILISHNDGPTAPSAVFIFLCIGLMAANVFLSMWDVINDRILVLSHLLFSLAMRSKRFHAFYARSTILKERANSFCGRRTDKMTAFFAKIGLKKSRNIGLKKSPSSLQRISRQGSSRRSTSQPPNPKNTPSSDLPPPCIAWSADTLDAESGATGRPASVSTPSRRDGELIIEMVEETPRNAWYSDLEAHPWAQPLRQHVSSNWQAAMVLAPD